MTTHNKIYRQSKIPLFFILVAFIVTFFINGDFGIKYVYNYFILSLLVIGEVLLQRKIYVSKITLKYFFLVTIVTFFSVLPNAYLDLEAQNYTISILIFFGCYLLANPSAKEVKCSNNILLVAAIVFATYIIVIRIFPFIFWDNIYPHLSQFSQAHAYKFMKLQNYGVFIGGSAIFADFVMALALFVCLGDYFSKSVRSSNNTKYIVVTLFLLAAIVVENRRGELIATITSVLAMYFFSVRNVSLIKLNSKKIVKFFAYFVLVVFVVAIMFGLGLLDRYIASFIDIGGGSIEGFDKTGNGRIRLWLTAVNMFEDSSKLFGIGWNQFRAKNVLSGMEGMNVHNDYLQWLCETGIVGFTLIFGITVNIWIENIKRCKYVFNVFNDVNSESKYYAVISFGVQTFLVIMHFVDPSFYKLLFWPFYSYSMIMYRMSLISEKMQRLSA